MFHTIYHLSYVVLFFPSSVCFTHLFEKEYFLAFLHKN
ncbi:hypothetical protein FH5_02273 [Priestia endophytica]|nr:hypothetical protein FH5_02273 [Priestia endophytica]